MVDKRNIEKEKSSNKNPNKHNVTIRNKDQIKSNSRIIKNSVTKYNKIKIPATAIFKAKKRKNYFSDS